MRAVPEALRARLATGVTTLAHAWRVTRRDGAVHGFTDHDRDLEFEGVTFHADSGLAAGAISESGFDTDEGAVSGVLSGDGVDEDDLAAGLWDGARVDLWRVDWTAPALRVPLMAGRIGDVRRGPAAFTAAIRGLQAAFDAPFGRVFSRFCDADVGDARCGVDLSAPAFHGDGVVVSVEGPRSLVASGLEVFADGWFARGVATFADDVRCDVAAHRVSGAHVRIDLATPPVALDVGASFAITAGCDKRFATCRGKFANGPAFRGFPDMPGNDVIVAGADPAQPFDGGSRRRG